VERGRAIYETGGDVQASMGDGLAPVPASLVPCASCHGADGRGRAEGGVAPPDIRHAALTRPYDVTAPAGRRHRPYDNRSLLRAITMGVDPSGNPLNNVMPRYQLSRAHAASLLAYLEVLGDESESGVTADEVTVVALVPDDARDALREWVAALNASGGIFGRHVALRFDGKLGDALAVIADRADATLASEADREGVPVLGTLTAHPVGRSHREVFDLLPGIEEQAGDLIRSAARSPLLIVDGDASLADEAKRNGIAVTTKIEEAKSILFLTTPATLPKSRDVRLLFPAPLAPPEVFREDNAAPSYVAYPLLPSSRSPHADAAVLAASLLEDVLRRVGREASRRALTAALEESTHHISVTGAHIVQLDHGRVLSTSVGP
jgi:mono/diheme cytochrome c family protein